MLLNAHDWKNPRDCWSKISFFSPLRFLILDKNILMNLFMGCKNFVFELFTKTRRNSSESSEIISMFFMFDHSWKVCQSFINICYLHDFFFIFVSCHIGPRWSNGWSNGVRRSFLIRILFLLNISWRTASIKNLFWLRYFLCSLSLLCIDLRIAVVIHVF